MNGDVYEGEIKDGKLYGKGVKKFATGDVLECEWKDNKANGKGVKTFSNGDAIEGQWKDNNLHGDAFYKNTSSDVWIMKKSSFVELSQEKVV